MPNIKPYIVWMPLALFAMHSRSSLIPQHVAVLRLLYQLTFITLFVSCSWLCYTMARPHSLLCAQTPVPFRSVLYLLKELTERLSGICHFHFVFLLIFCPLRIFICFAFIASYLLLLCVRSLHLLLGKGEETRCEVAKKFFIIKTLWRGLFRRSACAWNHSWPGS